jgi:putative oxidoreductase
MGKQWNEWASLPLRLILGFGFAYHGYPKLFGGHDMFVGMLTNLGIPAPGLMAWLVGLFEFSGGLLLIAGAFVGIISILGIVNMLVAMFTFHLPNGFNFMASPPGYEVNLLYIAGFVALVLGGAGTLSVDRWLTERRGTAGGSGI